MDRRVLLNSLMMEPPSDPGVRASTGNVFLDVTVAVPSFGDPTQPGGFKPLVFTFDGVPFMMVVTDSAGLDKLGKVGENPPQYALEMTGRAVVGMVPSGMGMVLDNGVASLQFVPEYVAHLRDKVEAEPAAPPARAQE